MATSLDSRLRTLEKRITPVGSLIVIIRAMTSNEHSAPIQRVRQQNGDALVRLHGETESEFDARIDDWVQQTGCPKLLFAD